MIKLLSERDSSLSYFEQILKNRGLNCSKEQFFDLNWDCVSSPYNLDYITEAADLYEKHIKNNSKIAILCDVDMDGFSSAALLMNYTNKQIAFGSWEQYTPQLIPVFHLDKTHGLADKEMMKRIRDEIKPNLFVVPDASGTKEQYEALASIGIDIIVLDHHDMEEKGNGKNIIVVNNQQSKGYENKALSGVGIVWQLCRVFDERCIFVAANDYLDLVALGNIGDVMDLKSKETRFLCWQGMQKDNIHSGLISFLQVTSFSMRDKPYGPISIAFNIAPLFNAICRIGSLEEKEYLFKCLLDDAMKIWVPSGKRGHSGEEVHLLEEGIRLAQNAKSRQDSRKNKLANMIDVVIDEENTIEHPVLVFAFDDFKEDYRALSGLVASKLSDTYKRPVILTFKNSDDTYSGSLRAPDNVPAYFNFKDQCAASGCCSFVAGHQYAAGIGIYADKVNDLISYFDDKYSELNTEVTEEVDFIFDADDPELIDFIEEMSQYSHIWGTSLKEPKIAIRKVQLSKSSLSLLGAKKTTLKINCGDFVLINFNSGEVEYNSLRLPLSEDDLGNPYHEATVICNDPTINEFRGGHIPQLRFSSYILESVKYNF